MAGGQRGDDCRTFDLVDRFAQLLDERNRLIAQCGFADIDRCRSNTIIGKFVKQDETG